MTDPDNTEDVEIVYFNVDASEINVTEAEFWVDSQDNPLGYLRCFRDKEGALQTWFQWKHVMRPHPETVEEAYSYHAYLEAGGSPTHPTNKLPIPRKE